MSRHKLVKGLDLDEELDDYDGADDGADEEELAPEDEEHLRRGTIEVRNTLGTDFAVTDKEIADSLYYYYYDVPKTVDYLLNLKTAKPKSRQGKAKPTQANPTGSDPVIAPEHTPHGFPYMHLSLDSSQLQAPLSIEEFFKDSPWLGVPENRRGEILIEPRYPRGRLLGGSPPAQDAPPKSKLAALAAARKKKENVSTASKDVNSSIALLDKLGTKLQRTKIDSQPTQPAIGDMRTLSMSPDPPTRKYTTAKRQAPEPAETQTKGTKRSLPSSAPVVQERPVVVPAPIARPSAFARTLCGISTTSPVSERPLPKFLNVYPAYTRTDTEFDPFAGPSPDDIVTKAQTAKGSKGAKDPTNAVKSRDVNATNAAAQGVADFTFADTPRIKSKHLNVIQEYEHSKPKNAANFVVIGHVDAGKSTLMGRLLHDLKIVDQRTIDKYQREASKIGKSSFALAWVLDQGTEERARGVTIDIATNQFSTPNTDFTILDAPGHRDFIPNMIAGASQADFAILVIDAGTGNFESGLKGQTKEHALLVRSMGVQRIVVAVNKMDSISWSEERYLEIEQQISAFLTAAGFLAKNLSFVACSGIIGDNVVHPTIDPAADWNRNGPTLIAALEYSEPISRALENPLRLTIDDIFRGGVQNPLSISGRLDAGTVQIGDSILILPANQTATVKALDVNTESTEWAVAGQNCILHLADIDQKFLRPGDVVCSPSAPIQCITTFTVKLLAFNHIMPMHCEIHKGRLHTPGKITKLVAILDKASGGASAALEGKKNKKPRLIKPGSVALVVVEADEAVPLELGGRIILRAGGETVGAGLVE